MDVRNLFSMLPLKLGDELFENIIQSECFKLERIVSKGHATPAGEWYDQDKNEWVILLKGGAGLAVEGEEGVVTLRPGDHLHLPAHLRHRVEWTDLEEETVWLALHY